MKKQWTAMKEIIQASSKPGDLFLSLINEKGDITCANATMLKELDLENPRLSSVNFFDLVHPAHLPGFKKLVNKTTDLKGQGIELYIRNGHYHPMRWHVNYLEE